MSFFHRLFPIPFLLTLALPAFGSQISLELTPNATTPNLTTYTEADYSSTHLYVDEVNGDSIPIAVFFNPGMTGVDEAEVYTNLNNRDQASVLSGTAVPNVAGSTGVPYGIIPPNGGYIVAGNTNCYYTAYPMTGVTGGFQTTLYANKTGAYRLTARFHLTSDPPLTSTGPNTWHYYNNYNDSNGIANRDAAIVVSPTKARSMVMYEFNAMYIDAEAPSSDTDSSTRSTFDYFDGGNNAPKSGARPFNLGYLQGLGVNWVWLQPVHPVGVLGRQTDPATGQAASVGSPYSVKNFFAINPLFSKSFVPGTTDEATGRANALGEFQGFVKAADTAGINIMLDVPFNHTAFDCEFDAEGQALWGAANPSITGTSQMEDFQANIYSRWNGGSADQTNSNNLGSFDYGARAYSAASIALASDRFDFGKFIDVHDVYFGNYAALVDLDESQDQQNYLNEGDWFDYTIGSGGVSNDYLDASTNSGNGHFDTVTQNVWKYFAYYIPYWLQQTGHTDTYGNLQGNSTLSDPVLRRAADDRGLDGIRADFAQGLPPQCWEYIMNVARSYKWDFVFLAESLDGGHVTYRSSRHFDVLNENVLFDLYNAQATSDFRSIYDGRRSAYGQSMVLWDTESHDEAGYADPYLALIRYAVNSTIDGVPDIFYGQEIGIAGAITPPNSNTFGTPFGFSNYQTNFGKPIPNFMIFNSLAPAWNALGSNGNGQAQLYPVYAGIGNARASSPALKSSNRYYLNAMDGSVPSSIFGVAKYANANAYPNNSDVVFAFVNLNRNSNESAVFNVNISQNNTNLFGIDPARTYNIKNISAITPARANTWLWSSPGITGSNILQNGIYVGLNQVPGSVSAWQTAPYEAQYLKLYDVTPPPAPGSPATPKAYSIGNTATFSWSPATDTEGGISGYQVTISTAPNGGGTPLYTGTVTSPSVTGTGTYGQKVYATIYSINNAGILSSSPSASGTAGTVLLDPNGDADGDGVLNSTEDAAGTNPLDNGDYFRILSVVHLAGGGNQITWSSVPGKSYQVQSSNAPTGSYTAISGTVTAAAGQTTLSYTDSSPVAPKQFYRVALAP